MGDPDSPDNVLLPFLQRLEESHSVRIGCPNGLHRTHLSVYDGMKLAGIKSGHRQRLNKYVATVSDHGVTEVVPCGKWIKNDYVVAPGPAPIPMMDWQHIQKLVSYLLRRSNKSQAEIEIALKLFDISEKLVESAYVVASAEGDTLDIISKCLPFPGTKQFAIGSYKLDMYFPDVKIALECNEHDHKGYNPEEELKRKKFIMDTLGARVVSYNPYAAGFSPLAVVREVVELLVTPEFHKWNEIRLLGPWRTAGSH